MAAAAPGLEGKQPFPNSVIIDAEEWNSLQGVLSKGYSFKANGNGGTITGAPEFDIEKKRFIRGNIPAGKAELTGDNQYRVSFDGDGDLNAALSAILKQREQASPERQPEPQQTIRFEPL